MHEDNIWLSIGYVTVCAWPLYAIVHNYRLCSLADNHSVRATKLARPSTVFTTKVHYCMLLREISRTTFNALVECMASGKLAATQCQEEYMRSTLAL